LSKTTRPLDLVFMGTPDFAACVLAALIEAGHRIRAAYSQPPRPAGRGHRLQASPIQALAEAHGIPVCCPTDLRDPAAQQDFTALDADAAIVAAYGLILPPAILAAPRRGCLNVHASLLPRWRGAAPVQRAILAGDGETGVTIMQMDAGLDTGAILLQQKIPIGAKTTAGELTEELTALGARLMVKALDTDLNPRPQPEEGAVYAKKLRREEATLDWRLAAAQLERQVRAFDPFPPSHFTHEGERIRVLAADVAPGHAAPGTVLDAALTIACGEGALRPLRLQRAGRGPADTADFLRGFPIPPGTILPCPAIA
jgi:methionyl-tRNA formyltransferase